MKVIVTITLVTVFLAMCFASNDVAPKKQKEFDVQDLLLEKNRDVEKRAQRLNRNFERMLQLVNILGQVDTFVSERLKLMLRKLALLAEDDDFYAKKRKS